MKNNLKFSDRFLSYFIKKIRDFQLLNDDDIYNISFMSNESQGHIIREYNIMINYLISII